MKKATVISSAAEAPILGKGRHDTAVYWAETGVGIAFQHAGCLELLRAHYGNRLLVVEDVYREWLNKADQRREPPMPWDDDQDRAAYAKWCKVVAACRHLDKPSATAVFGPYEQLDFNEEPEIRRLREELVEMPEADQPLRADDQWTHRGECATVRAAQLRAAAHARRHSGVPFPQVLISNDGKALKLAQRKRLGARTSAQVLLEIVAAGEQGLDAEAAWLLHLRMDEVARIPADRRPTGAEFFHIP